ncbi:uncharacterized protein B0I36DRAFT_137363 [Microdochium trichocladiopsis]|uniref:Uncharacterized protein n=1 Tax=Microdochium trichocladiopsis TaxID=1682393 RepID=A0A9P8Y046_9PEZI|nr:uncharacterized protein B0I36DRAFT_137363 [Microdochium trichocladiopsis]KAH7027328.1 hypothetical protein B0I36DRAFT_137363 [Microdochium trichocladiopsis]
MSGDSSSNGMGRRGSVTTAAFTNLFQRSNSMSAGNGNGRESATSVSARDQRRRLSVTTLGLGAQNPTTAPFSVRRGSISTTSSDAIDENAVEEDEYAKNPPNTPFTRRMSFGAPSMRTPRPGSGSPNGRSVSSGNTRPSPPRGVSNTTFPARSPSISQASNTTTARTPSDMLYGRSDTGYNWSEQLRSRAESSVAGARPSFSTSFSTSPPRGSVSQDRAKSVSDMPAPPQQAAAIKPKQPERPRPDAMQERILKGDFYMD